MVLTPLTPPLLNRTMPLNQWGWSMPNNGRILCRACNSRVPEGGKGVCPKCGQATYLKIRLWVPGLGIRHITEWKGMKIAYPHAVDPLADTLIFQLKANHFKVLRVYGLETDHTLGIKEEL
jgi:hypothetical protein